MGTIKKILSTLFTIVGCIFGIIIANKTTYVDASGAFRHFDDDFIDCKGNRFKWGSGFYDYDGNYIRWGETYKDSSGSRR